MSWLMAKPGLTRQRGLIMYGQTFSLDASKNDTSVVLDLLRASAAQMVCVGHAISFFISQWKPTELPLMQNVGVLLFFVLSGFLITYTLLERSKNPAYSFINFVVDRFARIYSALLPALIFVAIVDWFVLSKVPDAGMAPYYNAKTFILNIFMFESYRGVFSAHLGSSAFGSASPLWTLAIEWHIYIFVAAVFFIGARPETILFLIPIALFFGQVPTFFLLGAIQDDGVGRGLFALWLCGAITYLAIKEIRFSYMIAACAAVASAACLVFVTRTAHEYNFKTYAILVLFVFFTVAASQAQRVITSRSVKSVVAFFADYSFTLYLIHYTIMFAIRSLWPDNGWYAFFLAILLSNAIAAFMAIFTEMRHRLLASFLNRKRQISLDDVTAGL